MSKLLKTFTTAFVVLAMVLVMAPRVSAQSTADLMAQIASLLAQIQSLQAQISGASTETSYNFTKNLTIGSKGDEVTALQDFLISKEFLTMPSGVAKGYFGKLTKTALAAYQKSVGISPAVGYFGSKTRTYVNSLAAVTPPADEPIIPTVEGLTVAADTAVAATIGSGTAFNKALKLNFSAGSKDVKVSSITVTKSGFLGNTRLNGVDVVDSKGVRHGNVVTSINADNTVLITMTTDPIVVAAGKTESATIRFNLVSGAYTGTVAFAIASVSAIKSDTTTISGTFPISGNTMSVVDGGSSLASTTLEFLTTTGTSTLNIDSASAQEMTRFRVKELSSNEAIKLYSMILYNNGTAAEGDVKDVQLLDQDASTVLATAQQVGKYVKLVLDTPKEIAKGATRDFIIKTKIVSGASRTINYSVYESYDIDIRGVTTGVSVIPTGGNSQSFPIGRNGNTQTIGSGTMTLARASDSPSIAVTPGATDIILAKYTAKPVGENMELRKVSFYIATSTAGQTLLTGSVTVEVDGSIAYSTAASSLSTGSANAITLTSYPILTAGVNSTIVVKGSVNTTATSSASYQVKSFDITEVKRITTNDLTDPSVSAIDGNNIAVNAGSLTITTLVTPVPQSIVAGTNSYEFATFQLNAQTSGEDVKITRIIVTNANSGTTAVGTYIRGFALYKDSATSPLSVTGSTDSLSSNTTVTFNLSSADTITVTRATPVTLRLKANILTGATTNTTSTFNIAATGDVTVTGVTTGNSVTPSVSGSGQLMTIVSSGQLLVTNVSESGVTPSASNQVVNIGSTGKTYLAFKLASQYETQKITAITVYATSSAANSLATTTLTNIKLYEGGTERASASQLSCGNASYCEYTFSATDNLLGSPVPSTGVTLYVKADVSGGGVSKLGDHFKFLVATTTAKGSSSNNYATITGSATADGYTYIVPQNVKIEAVAPTTQVGLTAGQTVAIFKVTNSGAAPIYFSTSTNPTFANGGSATSSVQTSAWELWASNLSGSATKDNSYGTSTAGTSLSSSTVAFGGMNAITEANRTINGGGGYRYLIIETNIAAENNNTFSLSVSALGNIRFYVKESELGYDANGNGDLNDTITTGMYIDGITAPTTVTSKT